MELVEDITDNVDKQMVTAVVFIDLLKVFDTIEYTILILTLCHYDNREIALNWLNDYFSQRSQYMMMSDQLINQ